MNSADMLFQSFTLSGTVVHRRGAALLSVGVKNPPAAAVFASTTGNPYANTGQFCRYGLLLNGRRMTSAQQTVPQISQYTE